MFLKLRKIWKQRRELKKGMGSEAIPIIATPSMNHRSLATNTHDALSTNEEDNVFESSTSDNCLRYSARLKVNISESIHFDFYYFQNITISTILISFIDLILNNIFRFHLLSMCHVIQTDRHQIIRCPKKFPLPEVHHP